VLSAARDNAQLASQREGWDSDLPRLRQTSNEGLMLNSRLSWPLLRVKENASRRWSSLEYRSQADRIDVVFDDCHTYFQVDGFDLGETADPTFALWSALPYAMHRGVNIRTQHRLDPVSLQNARRLVALWSRWLPDYFHYIAIDAPTADPRPPQAGAGRLFFFSGGLDSSSMLLRQSAFRPEDRVLTICGLDYKEGDERFHGLLARSAPLLDFLGLDRIVVTTNIGRNVRNLKMTHGFVLAAIGFIFANRFSSCHLAADARREDEFSVFPWGTNSISNELFRSSSFRLVTEDLDEGRTDKVRRLNDHPDFLPGLSFCSDSRYRPDNCGSCAKCVRTKARFYVLRRSVPEIFLDNHFDEGHIRKLNFKDKVIFQSMLTLFVESGPDYSNPIVSLIDRKLEAGVTALRRRRRLGF
jgi:hypothetical protein